MSILEIEHLSHGFGEQVLYRDCSLHLYKGEHMGLVGRNGTGKSTLIQIITGKILPDEGQIQWAPRIRIGYLDQHAQVPMEKNIYGYLETAFSQLLAQERELVQLHEEMAYACTDDLLEKAGQLQEQLEKGGIYEVDRNIRKVAAGLGLTAIGIDRKMGSLSGGQRAKVILARLTRRSLLVCRWGKS